MVAIITKETYSYWIQTMLKALILKFIWKGKGTRIAKRVLKKIKLEALQCLITRSTEKLK